MDEKITVYKVEFKGFAYVYADSPEEAIDFFNDDTFAYSEMEALNAEMVDEDVLKVFD